MDNSTLAARSAFQNAPLYQTVLAPINKLVHSDSKSRKINDDGIKALMKSIQEDPDFLKVRPVIVNLYPGREGVVIGGDKRMMACEKLGKEKIPVIFVNVTPEKENAWNKKDNHHNGEWDPEGLKLELMELHGTGFKMDSLGFTPTELVTNMGDFGKQNQDGINGKSGTPRKAKVKAGASVTCPNCQTQFTTLSESPGT